MKCKYITIEREYASGGRLIGEKLGEQLNIPCYSSEILSMAANRAGALPEELAEYEESANSSLIYTLFRLGQLGSLTNKVPKRDELMVLEATIINELAAKESPCIFIGRAAHHVLKERDDVLSVFVYADHEARKNRAVEQYNVPGEYVEDTLRKYDQRRANYYKSYSGQQWDDRAHYHLMLDSGTLGIQGCLDAIISQL